MHIARKVLLASTLCLMTAGTVSSTQYPSPVYSGAQAIQVIKNPNSHPNTVVAIEVGDIWYLIEKGPLLSPPPQCREEKNKQKLDTDKMIELYNRGEIPNQNVALHSTTTLIKKIKKQNDEIAELEKQNETNKNKIAALEKQTEENKKN